MHPLPLIIKSAPGDGVPGILKDSGGGACTPSPNKNKTAPGDRVPGAFECPGRGAMWPLTTERNGPGDGALGASNGLGSGAMCTPPLINEIGPEDRVPGAF